MEGWQLQQGATLLMPSGPDGDHLFVVLNDPKVFPGYGANPHVLLVNLSRVPRTGVHYDSTRVLQPGCHPFVTAASYIVYRSARIDPVVHVLGMVGNGIFRPHQPMPAGTVASIRAGLATSPFTKREFKGLSI